MKGARSQQSSLKTWRARNSENLGNHLISIRARIIIEKSETLSNLNAIMCSRRIQSNRVIPTISGERQRRESRDGVQFANAGSRIPTILPHIPWKLISMGHINRAEHADNDVAWFPRFIFLI
jgi:hypothetical protein